MFFNLDLGPIIFYVEEVFGLFWIHDQWSSYDVIWSYPAWSCFVQFACFLCFFRFPEWLYHSHRKNALMEFQLNETRCWYLFIQPLLLISSCIATALVDPHQHQLTGRIQRWIVSATRPRWRVGQWLRWPSIRLRKLYVADGKIWYSWVWWIIFTDCSWIQYGWFILYSIYPCTLFSLHLVYKKLSSFITIYQFTHLYEWRLK